MRSFRLKAETSAVAAAVGVFFGDENARRHARLRCVIGTAARCFEAEAVATVERPVCVMVTLTYAGGNECWSPRHISRFLDVVRHWLRRRGLPMQYVWVAELQKRGVVHYHVALWLPSGVRLPKPDEAGWWPHGWSRIEVARRAVPYLMKYLSKGNTVTGRALPGGARSHGRGGLSETWREVLRWLAAPAFVRSRCAVGEVWRRAPGGGFASPVTGEWLPSEWRRVWCGTRYGLERIRDHGRPFEADGPFCWVRGV